MYSPAASAAHKTLKKINVMKAYWNFESSECAQEHKLHKSWSGKIFLYYDLEIIMEDDVENNVKFPAYYL